MESCLKFTKLAGNERGWCKVCDSADPSDRSFRIHDQYGTSIFRHVSCVERETQTDRGRVIDACAVHRDVANAFGPSIATLDSIASSLATTFPDREIDVTNAFYATGMQCFRSPGCGVVAIGGAVHGWCKRCGVDKWGQPMVMFSMERSDSRTMYHKQCVLELCAGDGTHSYDVRKREKACVDHIRRELGWTNVWDVPPPTAEMVRDLLARVFPGSFAEHDTDAQPACAETNTSGPAATPTSADKDVEMINVLLSTVASVASLPTGPAGQAGWNAAMNNMFTQLMGHLAVPDPKPAPEPEAPAPPAPPSVESVMVQMSERVRDVERRLAILESASRSRQSS